MNCPNFGLVAGLTKIGLTNNKLFSLATLAFQALL